MNEATQLPSAFFAQSEPIKFLARMKNRASKNFRWTRSQALKDASHLAYWCHIFYKDDEAMEVCEFLNNCEFNGNFNLWTWIEKSLALHSRLLRRQGYHAQAKECMSRIPAAGFVNDRLNGLLLDGYLKGIRRAIDGGDRTLERDWRLIAAGELCTLIELQGSTRLPTEVLELSYRDNLLCLRKLVKAEQ